MSEPQTLTITILEIECPLCGHKIRGTDKIYMDMQYRLHLDYDCNVARLLKAMPKGSTMGDVHYLLTGKYPKGYKPQKRNSPAPNGW